MKDKAKKLPSDQLVRKLLLGTNLYSSLIPYAMTMSGCSFMTALAAAFMRSSALRSFGFSNSYFAENLSDRW